MRRKKKGTVIMSEKNSKETWFKKHKVTIVAIIGIIVAILAWLFPNPLEMLIKKTDKGLVSIQQKCDASSAAIKNLNLTGDPQVVMQIHQTMMKFANDYQLVNKHLKQKKEVSRRRYLKSLSAAELVKLTLNQREVSGTIIREVLMPSISKMNDTINLLDEKASAIQKMHYQKTQDNNKVLFEKLLGWQTEMTTIGVELDNYVKTFNPYNNQGKPERKLFKICKKSIYAQKEVESLKVWSDCVETYIDCLSDLQEYYVKNQPNNQ